MLVHVQPHHHELADIGGQFPHAADLVASRDPVGDWNYDGARLVVVPGIARTGALILLFAFGSLAATPGTEVKIFATALGLGILIDATVVRATRPLAARRSTCGHRRT